MSYEREEERLKQLLHEILTDEEEFSEENDSEVDLELVSNHDSDTKQDCEEEYSEHESTEESYYLAKDNQTKWNKNNLGSRVRTRAHNIITQTPGVIGNAKNAKSVLDCWEIFFTDGMLDLILKNTNDEIQRKQVNYANKSNVQKIDMSEMKAVFGLLYLAGFYKSSHQNLDDLWADGIGVELFRSTISLCRFRFILRYLRFDDRSTRTERRSFDKLAPIRQIFEEKKNRGVKSRCEICPRKKDRKTSYCCQKCAKQVCLEHIIPWCPDCANTANDNY